MTPYTLALFFHVGGAIGFFVSVGAQAYCLGAMRRARSVEQVRTLGDLITRASGLAAGSLLVLLVAGIYMAATVWGFATGWIAVAIGAIAALALIGRYVVTHLRAIVALVNDASDGPILPDLAAHIQSPVLGVSLGAILGILIGIVFLMTNKPSLSVSLLVIACALALGLIAGISLWLRGRAQVQRVAAPSKRSRS